jgi:hypothetical protein
MELRKAVNVEGQWSCASGDTERRPVSSGSIQAEARQETAKNMNGKDNNLDAGPGYSETSLTLPIGQCHA